MMIKGLFAPLVSTLVLGLGAACVHADPAKEETSAAMMEKPTTMSFDAAIAKHEVATPVGELVLELVVDVAPRIDMGKGPEGHRFIIPITGGEFGGKGIRGEVLAGGADRQLLRSDGVLMLDALYEIRAEDGAVITVNNKVMIDRSPDAPPPRSIITLKAPDGPHGWMNRRVFVGTLTPLLPDRNAVLIRVFQLK